MVLVPWRFYEDLSSFHREMNQLFDRFFGKEFLEETREDFSLPPLRFVEGENEIVITLETPGFSPKDLEVSIQNNILVIKGERGKKNSLNANAGSFMRTIQIPKKIEIKKIEAKFKENFLMLILPKLKEKTSLVKIVIE